MEPAQARIIGGFGQAAWLAGERLVDACPLTLDREKAALDALVAATPAGAEILGIDSFGIDLWLGRRPQAHHLRGRRGDGRCAGVGRAARARRRVTDAIPR